MNRKNKIIFLIVYVVAVGLTINGFLRNGYSKISELFVLLFFQSLIFIIVYLGSRKKYIVKPNFINKTVKGSKFPRVLYFMALILFILTLIHQVFSFIYPTAPDTTTYQEINSSSIMNSVTYTIANADPPSIKEIILCLIAITGTLLMLRSMKIGFYLYLLVEILTYCDFIPMLIEKAGVETIFSIWPHGYDLVLLVIFATQLKHMTWRLNPAPATN